MLFWLVFSIFSLTKDGNFTVQYSVQEHYSFGFAQNGTYNISLLQADISSKIIIYLALEKPLDVAIKNFWDGYDFPTFPINATFYGHPISFHGTIEKAGVYSVAYRLPDASPPYAVHVVYEFLNPGSLIDDRFHNLSFWIPISISLFGILALLWFGNWFFHFNVQIGIHYLASSSISLNLICRFIQLFQYESSLTNDSTTFAFVISLIFRILSKGSVFFLVIIAAKGWCILQDSIPVSGFILDAIASLGFVTFDLLMVYIEFGNWIFLIMFLEVLCFIFLIQDLLTSLKRANVQINAYLYVISRRGIASETTPVFQKHLLYQKFQYSIIAFCFLVVVKLLISFWVDFSFWFGNLFDDISDLIMLYFLGFIFRIRKSDSNGYTQFDVDEDRAQIALHDIGHVDYGNGSAWSLGVLLPPPPQIITVNSPDGLETVAARRD